MYLPLIAVVVAVVPRMGDRTRRLQREFRRHRVQATQHPIEWLLAAGLASLCTLTVWRNAEYRSGVTIGKPCWIDGRIPGAPQPRVELRRRRLDEAMVPADRGAAAPDARRRWPSSFWQRARHQATAELAEFVRLQPNDPEIREARNPALYFQAGDFDRAKSSLNVTDHAAVRHGPSVPG